MVDRTPPSPGGPHRLRIELGRARLKAQAIAELVTGSVVSLDALVDQPVDIIVGERLVARGEVLVLDGCFCIRVTELANRREAA